MTIKQWHPVRYSGSDLDRHHLFIIGGDSNLGPVSLKMVP